MTKVPDNLVIDKCMDKILEVYQQYSFSNLEHTPFDPESGEFSVTYECNEGNLPYLRDLVEVTIRDGDINRTFLFGVYREYWERYAECYDSDWVPTIKDRYLYKEEVTEYPERGHVLYMCDRPICTINHDCKECRYARNIEHTKNFE